MTRANYRGKDRLDPIDNNLGYKLIRDVAQLNGSKVLDRDGILEFWDEADQCLIHVRFHGANFKVSGT